jgi:hypothetical protein
MIEVAKNLSAVMISSSSLKIIIISLVTSKNRAEL